SYRVATRPEASAERPAGEQAEDAQAGGDDADRHHGQDERGMKERERHADGEGVDAGGDGQDEQRPDREDISSLGVGGLDGPALPQHLGPDAAENGERDPMIPG